MPKIKVGPNIFIPMPVSLVGSIVKGKPNFMAAGWVTRVNSNPPYVAVGINKSHYTTLGLKEKRSFSINFPSSDLVVETDYCGLFSGRNNDKSGIFELFYGELKAIPMIKRRLSALNVGSSIFTKCPQIILSLVRLLLPTQKRNTLRMVTLILRR